MIRWYVLPSNVFEMNFSRQQILTHSCSRVVMKTLLHAHKTKRISVYVTEARPRGLGYDCTTLSSDEMITHRNMVSPKG